MSVTMQLDGLEFRSHTGEWWTTPSLLSYDSLPTVTSMLAKVLFSDTQVRKMSIKISTI